MDYIEYLNSKIQGKLEALSDSQKQTIADADQKRAALSNKYRLYNQLFRNVVAEFKKLDKTYTKIKYSLPVISSLFHDDNSWQVDNDLIAWNLPSIFDNMVNKITGLKGHIYDWETTGKPRLEKALEWIEQEDVKKSIIAFESKMDSFVEDVLKPLVEVHYPAYERCKQGISEQFARKSDIENGVYYQVLKEEIDSPELKEFIKTHVIEKKTPTLDPTKHSELSPDEYVIANERLDIFKDFITSYANDDKNQKEKRVDRFLVSHVRSKVDQLKREGAKEPEEEWDFGRFATWY